MNKNWKFLWVKIILLAIGIGLLLYFFFDGLKFEILGSAMGIFITMVATDFIKSIFLLREDKRKVSDKFTYDEVFYRKQLKIGGGQTCIWYDAVTYEGDNVYEVSDSPEKYFELDPVIQVNYSAIMQAHLASLIANPTMIRLDDYKIDADGKVKLFTSRTTYYNDLVTNRAMDYEFSDNLSIREIFENGKYLSPLNESKMSNHIGLCAMIFYGNSMLVAHRGGNATLSKNKFTSGFAVGLSENDIRTVHNYTENQKAEPSERFPSLSTDDLFTGIILLKLSEAVNISLSQARILYKDGKIHIHTLGLGQLVYTGGKPQFYFAIVIDESVDLSLQQSKHQIRDRKKTIDFNKNMIFTEEIKLVKNDGYTLKLKKQGTKKYVKGEAEKSFFINYWHLLARPPIEGVPSWIYNN